MCWLHTAVLVHALLHIPTQQVFPFLVITWGYRKVFFGSMLIFALGLAAAPFASLVCGPAYGDWLPVCVRTDSRPCESLPQSLRLEQQPEWMTACDYNLDSLDPE